MRCELAGDQAIAVNNILARRTVLVKMLHAVRGREVNIGKAVLALLLYLKYNMIKWP